MGRIPNLFVVGAMRAGTTALHETLSTHPQIFMSPFKEPAFFADPTELADDSRIIAEAGYAANESKYLSLFDGAGDADLVGESSTHYTKAPRITGVADRISEYSPDARIVYLVRDPVQRALSHYEFDLVRRYETRPAQIALRENPIYCQMSDYAMQIDPYLRAFEPDRVSVVVLEELIAAPEVELRSLYSWLSVDPMTGAARLPQSNQITDEVRLAHDTAALRLVRRAGWYGRVVTRIPKPVRARLRRVAARDVTRADHRSDDIVAMLTDRLDPTIERLERVLGRSFELWRSQ
jgi:hypothetical protein